VRPHSLADTVTAPIGPAEPGLPRPDAPSKLEETAPAEAERTEPTVIDSLELNAERRLDADVARLYVGDYEGDQFTLEGFAPQDLDHLPVEQRFRPDISLADIARVGGQPPRRVLSSMYVWSRDVASITQWLCALVRAESTVHLTIDDKSGHEVPWELLTLTLEEGETYLGAALPISRLSCGVATATETHPDAPATAAPVLAYLSDELAAKENDVGGLSAIAVDTRPTLADFVAEVRRGASVYALAYLACHGIHDDDIYNVALGSARDDGERVVLGDLYYDLRKVRIPYPIFVNACHSGRLLKDRSLRTRGFLGFPELFLNLGSPGVIGTMGEVNDSFAASFARDLLLETVDDPGVSLPEALRRARSAVVTAYDAGQVSAVELVCAFMYTYYGEPGTSARPAVA
jgi:hypothetical protein